MLHITMVEIQVTITHKVGVYIEITIFLVAVCLIALIFGHLLVWRGVSTVSLFIKDHHSSSWLSDPWSLIVSSSVKLMHLYIFLTFYFFIVYRLYGTAPLEISILLYGSTTLRNDFVILQLYWWLFSSSENWKLMPVICTVK